MSKSIYNPSSGKDRFEEDVCLRNTNKCEGCYALVGSREYGFYCTLNNWGQSISDQQDYEPLRTYAKRAIKRKDCPI